MVPSTNFNHELLQDFHLEELLDCRYYYGNLTEKESEEILKPEKYGTYLIRDGPIESKRDEDCPPGMVRGPNGQLWPAWVFGKLKTNIPLILSLKTTVIHHCKIISELDFQNKSRLKIQFNDSDVRPKKIPTLPLSMEIENILPPNNSIIGSLLSTIYKFNPALAYPLRRNVTLSLKDLARKQILESLNNKTKKAEELELPKILVKYISDWKTCDQDLDRFPWH